MSAQEPSAAPASLGNASATDWFNLAHFFADRLVELWHDGAFDPDDCSLARFMGLTEDEGAMWVECRYHALAMALREREA